MTQGRYHAATMATSHYCNGKWRDGPVSACPRHKQKDRKQPSVFRTGDSGGDGGGSSSSSDD